MKKFIEWLKNNKRLRSKVVWGSVISYVFAIVAVYNPNVIPELKVLASSIMGIFVAFGILNNPTERDEF